MPLKPTHAPSSLVLVTVPHDQGQGPEPLSLRAGPAGADGSINVFVTGRTDLIVDINGYFVP